MISSYVITRSLLALAHGFFCIYTPAGKRPFPVIVYFHGGGWVIADKDVYDGGARGLSKAAQAIVLSVDYRRAPEKNSMPC